MTAKSRTYLISMALFWMVFGLGTILYPRMMQLFMSADGIAASTPFSDSVWFHDGMDILSVCLLLFALSAVPATKVTLRLAATVGLMPPAAIVFTLVTTPYWTPLILGPAAACFGFAVYGFALAARTDKPSS